MSFPAASSLAHQDDIMFSMSEYASPTPETNGLRLTVLHNVEDCPLDRCCRRIHHRDQLLALDIASLTVCLCLTVKKACRSAWWRRLEAYHIAQLSRMYRSGMLRWRCLGRYLGKRVGWCFGRCFGMCLGKVLRYVLQQKIALIQLGEC